MKTPSVNFAFYLGIGGSLTTLGLIICDDPIDRFLAYISAVTGLATLVVAIGLYDEFDRGKLRFSKRLDAVERLIFSVSDFPFDVYYVLPSWLIHRRTGLFLNIHPVRYFLNWYNIKAFKANDNTLPLYFTKALIEKFNDFSQVIHNAWVPPELKHPFKAIFLFKVIHRFNTSEIEGKIVVLDAKKAGLGDANEIYRLEYDGEVIESFDQFLNKMETALILFENYFEKHLGEKPDFSEE